jgi:hypothetical protein
MQLRRSVTVTSALLGIVLDEGALGTSASTAPTKIGPVANLTLSAAAAGGGYTVTSSWTPLAGATAYPITLTSGGATVASVTQTSPPWSATLQEVDQGGHQGQCPTKAVAVAGALDKGDRKAGFAGLRKGRLVLRASARDSLGNASAVVSKDARLTS